MVCSYSVHGRNTDGRIPKGMPRVFISNDPVEDVFDCDLDALAKKQPERCAILRRLQIIDCGALGYSPSRPLWLIPGDDGYVESTPATPLFAEEELSSEYEEEDDGMNVADLDETAEFLRRQNATTLPRKRKVLDAIDLSHDSEEEFNMVNALRTLSSNGKEEISDDEMPGFAQVNKKRKNYRDTVSLNQADGIQNDLDL